MKPQDIQASPEAARPSFANEPLKPMLRAEGERPFHDSWEAEAYAIGNLLVKLNHLTAKEWMNLMAESIQEAQNHGDPDTGETYYHHWCRSIEKFCFQNGISDPDQHQILVELWSKAILNTPHGVPLTIENSSLSPETKYSVVPSSEHPNKNNSMKSHSFHEHHSHERPENPPETYFEPIAKQVLKP